jgi:hypothetical protein
MLYERWNTLRWMRKGTYSAEIFNFVNVIRDDRGLLSLVMAIKFGNVVDLNVILDTITHAEQSQ